jgi:hypothetical protein
VGVDGGAGRAVGTAVAVGALLTNGRLTVVPAVGVRLRVAVATKVAAGRTGAGTVGERLGAATSVAVVVMTGVSWLRRAGVGEGWPMGWLQPTSRNKLLNKSKLNHAQL